MSGPAPVYILTLGCPKNEVDTDRMAAALDGAGYETTDELDEARVAIVNTCAFIQEATEQSIEAVLDLAGEWKAAEPGRLLLVAGCMASRYAGDLAGELPEVDAFLPVADEATIAEVVSGLLGRETAPSVAGGAAPRTTPGASAYLMVSDGCFRACAFCTIPSIRGPYVSRPATDLVAEARLLTAGGARELVLIGQDTSAWGRGLPPSTDGPRELAGLVRTLCATPGASDPLGGVRGLDWLRLMYVQPDGLSDELIETMASHPQVCHYLEMPLQHASARVLRSMRRSGSADAFLELIGKARAAMPDIRVRTTLIAGFPGETDDDIEVLLEFLEAARFDYVGVFAYSPEEGTEAATLPGQLSGPERTARAQLVSDAGEAIGTERQLALVGETLDVLVEGVDPDGVSGLGEKPAWVGRWRGQAPDIDGAVYVEQDVVPGSIVRVRILEAFGYDLLGEVTGP